MSEQFDKIPQKYDINSLKYHNYVEFCQGHPERKKEIIPLWVADMDFEIAPSLKEELNKLSKIEKTQTNEGQNQMQTLLKQQDYQFQSSESGDLETKQCIQEWFESKYQLPTDFIKQEHIYHTQNTLNSYLQVLKGITKPGEGLVVLTPVYYMLMVTANLNGRVPESSDLSLKMDNGGNLRYYINFQDLEEKISKPNNKCIVISNPHNPTGRVWTKEELKRLGELCVKYDKYLISDEIFGDFVFDQQETIIQEKDNDINNNNNQNPNTSFVSVLNVIQDVEGLKQKCFICFSPSKTFNISGVGVAFAIIFNEQVQNKFKFFQKAIGFNEQNSVQGKALVRGAYSQEGQKWITQLTSYLQNNFKYLKQELKDIFTVVELEAGYLGLIQYKENINIEDMENCLRKKDLVLQNMEQFYYPPKKTREIRINIALPREVLKQACQRIKEAVQEIDQQN